VVKVKDNYPPLCEEFKNEKKKEQKKKLTFQGKDLNPRFSVFSPP
jgi:hypothetical protein